MNFVPFVLQCIALVCLMFAFTGWFSGPAPRPVWFPLGMFLWLLSLMINASLHAAGSPALNGHY
jgi:hypothetical protein